SIKSLMPSKGNMNSTVFFTGRKAASDVAAFINGTMTRYLDYNDTYLSKEALHPSDNIPPLIAVGEALDKNGKELLNAANVSYEVVCSLSDQVSIRDRGWDHVTYISISAASGIANLMSLEGEKFANALNLSINNNISMRQTRAGELSKWKGATAANACRNSLFGSMLARNGFSGPSPIFEGEMGFFKQVSGTFDLSLDNSHVRRTMIKNFPVEYHAMSAAEASLAIRDRIEGKIESIDVETFTVANTIIIKDPEKLKPKTRETADHSMPFIIAYTIEKGEPNPNSFNEKYLNDKKILSLIEKMRFKVTKEYDELYPENLPFKIKVKTSMGVYEEELIVPKGHFKKPYSWDDVKIKAGRVMSPESASDLTLFCKSMERKEVSELIEVINNVHS
ncbi:MAG: MmgE/PrpD family protein, partial [Thermoplasmataceae archaeon]